MVLHVGRASGFPRGLLPHNFASLGRRQNWSTCILLKVPRSPQAPKGYTRLPYGWCVPYGAGTQGRGYQLCLGQAVEASQRRCCLKVAGREGGQHPSGRSTRIHYIDGVFQELRSQCQRSMASAHMGLGTAKRSRERSRQGLGFVT